MGDRPGNFVQSALYSLLFPLILITACAASFVFGNVCGLVPFAFLAFIAGGVVSYATTNLWAMLALIAFVLSALPLARIEYREYATRQSGVIGAWLWVAALCGVTAGLAVVWPQDTLYTLEVLTFSGLLIMTSAVFWAAVLATLKLSALNRPQPGREVVEAQKTHGDAQLAGEAEAQSLLNSGN